VQRERALRAVESLRRLRGRPRDAPAWLSSPHMRAIGVIAHQGEHAIEIQVDPSAASVPRIPTRIELPELGERAELVVAPAVPVRVLGAAAAAVGPIDIGRADQGWSGSGACRVRWRNRPGTYLLSNAHVLALSGLNVPEELDPIIRPSFAQGGRAPADTIAELSNWTRFVPGADFPNLADAAIALLAVPAANLPGMPQPTAINPHIAEGMPVRFLGAATGVIRTGVVSRTDVCRELPYPQPGTAFATYGFCGLAECTTGAKHGDSGSLVLDIDGRAVGLLFAGSDEIGVFTPIKTVFDLLDIELDSPGPGGGGAPIDPTTLGFKPQVAHLYRAIDILARTLFGEARSEPVEGVIAVAAVVANRTHAQRQAWGLTIEAVCKADRQFSCWNPPQSESDRRNQQAMLNAGPEDPLFARCIEIARNTANGDIRDITSGANHYYRAGGDVPDWAVGVVPTATIGRHVFLRL
jgi:N-acetylmuramoyl-L-alanine amidase